MCKNKTQLYSVTSYGAPYIQSNDIADIYDNGVPIIGTAEFMLCVFNPPVYELDGVQYPPEALDAATKIQVLMDDGFVAEYGNN